MCLEVSLNKKYNNKITRPPSQATSPSSHGATPLSAPSASNVSLTFCHLMVQCLPLRCLPLTSSPAIFHFSVQCLPLWCLTAMSPMMSPSTTFPFHGATSPFATSAINSNVSPLRHDTSWCKTSPPMMSLPPWGITFHHCMRQWLFLPHCNLPACHYV